MPRPPLPAGSLTWARGQLGAPNFVGQDRPLCAVGWLPQALTLSLLTTGRRYPTTKRRRCAARGAPPTRIACRTHEVVVEEEGEEGHAIHRAAGVVGAERDGRGRARPDRGGGADVDTPRNGDGVAGGTEHPLHRALGATAWRRALRAAFTAGLGHPVAPHLRRRRDVVRHMRRTHDRARGRHRPGLHRQAAPRATASSRAARRRLNTHTTPARHVAPRLRCARRSPSRQPVDSLLGIQRPDLRCARPGIDLIPAGE